MRKNLLILISLFALASVITYSQDGANWKWQHQTPQGNANRFVKIWDANNWYTMGINGTFMKTTDGGATWAFHHKAGALYTDGSYTSNYDAHFFDLSTGVAVGFRAIVRTTNGGATWDTVYTAVSGTTSRTLYQVYFLNANVGYAVGTSGLCVKTTDAGLTWNAITTGVTTSLYDIWTPNDTLIIIATTSGNTRRSVDGGATWTAVNVGNTSSLYKLEFLNSTTGMVAGSSGKAALTTDAGLTWTNASTGLATTATFYDIDFLSGLAPFKLNEGFEDATFPPTNWQKVSVLGAKEWVRTTTKKLSGDASAFMDYETTGGEDWLITPKVLVASDDSLVFWVSKRFSSSYPPDSLLVKVSSTDSAVANFTTTVYSVEVNSLSSTTWTRVSVSLSSFAGQNVFIAFEHKDTDGNGVYLDDVRIGSFAQMTATYLTGYSMNMYLSTDLGTTWNVYNHLTPTQPWTSTYYATDVMADGTVLTGGAFGLLNKKVGSADATVYTTFQRAGTIYDIWAQSATGKVITVGAPSVTGVYDQFFYSTNGGGTWSISTTTMNQGITASPKHVEIPEPSNEELIKGEIESPTSTATFRSIDMLDANNGWACGTNSAVYKTTNGGVTWDSVATPIPASKSLYKIDFVNANVGWVFSFTTEATGTVWKTTDGGATWTPTILPGSGLATQVYSAHMMTETKGYLVNYVPRPMITTDGGTTWTEQAISDGYTGTMYDIQMVNDSVGFIAAGSGRMYKTTNGGTLWDTIPNLPFKTGTRYALHFINPSVGVVAGSAGTTMKTSDGGVTWELVNTNGGATNYGIYIAQPTSGDTSAVFLGATSSQIFKYSSFIVPVELSSFTSNVNGNSVTLNWSTATEKNNFGFDVERRVIGEEWNKIGFVNGNGTSLKINEYSFTDSKLSVGNYNYRIKQLDFDGTYKYYELSGEIEIGSPEYYSLSQNYPNPFNPTTAINYAIPVDGMVTLTIFNSLGEKIRVLVNEVQQAGHYSINFDATQLTSGLYFYKIEAGNFSSVKKMMLLK